MNDDTNRSDAGRARSWLPRALARIRARAAVPSRLAIGELPDELAQLAPGQLYAVYAMPRTPGCDALIWASAREARTRDVTVVLARSRAETAARLREIGFAPGVPMRGWPRNLNVLAMSDPVGAGDGDGFADESSMPPAPQFAPPTAPPFARLFGALRALKQFRFRANALYLVEGAERWFSWHDPAALAREGRLLANWCAVRRITLVLLLNPRPGSAADVDDDMPFTRDDRTDEAVRHEAVRHEFHGACAGVARLRRTHGELLWHVDFWRTGAALVTGEVRALRFADDGRLTVAPDVAQLPEGGAQRGGAWLARDENRIVATRAVVANERFVPRDWEIVDDARALLDACTGAQAATVLLDHQDGAGLETLCATVHTLRRQCGRALKIVVVERREVLRHQYELLLLSLGANLLLGRDIPFSRMQSLLRSLQGQLDTRPIVGDYRAALAAALTDAVRGYLSVARFCERIDAVLKRGALLQLPHVLAKLTLQPDVAHADVLAHCAPRRAGDVFTADAAHVYVFLFACRLPDADTALARIFDGPVERWSAQTIYLAEESLAHEIAALADANRRAPIADYSDLFADTTALNGADAAQTNDHAKVSEAAQQLKAVEDMLASVAHENGDAARDETGDEADDITDDKAQEPSAPKPESAPPRARRAEPCAMPLIAAEEP